jgi:hypothetical protein
MSNLLEMPAEEVVSELSAVDSTQLFRLAIGPFGLNRQRFSG